MDIWYSFNFDAGAIKPERAFYTGLTVRLGCEASELLMRGDIWRDDIVGAVEPGSHARWVDRENRASHSCRFIGAYELGDAYPDRRKAAQMMELELAAAPKMRILIIFMPSGGRFSRHGYGCLPRMHQMLKRQLPSERWTIILILVMRLKPAVLA